ncbi:MAG: hypothetical protein JNK12_24890 [Acidimicrobiales bacterium]|nr:hypothetical protein [Acidimicrobiales bacterium]
MAGAEMHRPNLAAAYELALELEAAGLDPADLAERLGITVAAVPSLLAIAHAKSEQARENA